MPFSIRVKIEGVQETIERLQQINEKARENAVKIMAKLGEDSEEYWQEQTPKHTGRLRAGDELEVQDLIFKLSNGVRYYIWVDKGHMTPRGFIRREKHRSRYITAKKRSRVEGRAMTEKALKFIEDNCLEYLSHVLDGV